MPKRAATKKPHSKVEDFKTSQAEGAATTLLEQMFNDFHRNRRQIYVMNLVRGIFFGLGSVLGGTVVIAFIIWILSLFSETWLGPLVERFMDTVQQAGII